VAAALGFCAALAVAPGAARALDPGKELSECTVQAWRVRDGLPGAWVRGIAQTPEGYLWIATYGGVTRYGGDRLQGVSSARPFERLANAVALLAEPEGRLWIAPAEGDPVCWRAGGGLDRCLAPGRTLGAGARIVALARDADGGIWIAAGNGIHHIDAAGTPRLIVAREGLPPDPVTALARRAGALWIGTTGGLYREQAGQVVAATNPGAAALGAVGALLVDRAGRLWVAALRGLLRLGPDGEQLFDRTQGWPGRRPTAALEDADGNLWIATRGGLVRFRDGAFARYGLTDGLPDEDLTALFEDREGSLWLGTRGAGLVQVTDRTLDSRSGPPALREAWISALCEESGALFVATSSGLWRWQPGGPGGGTETRFSQADGLPSDNVLTVHPAPGGGVWVGTDRGLARLRDGRIERPVPLAAAIASLYVDRAGVTWLGSDRGLVRVQGDQHHILPSAPELAGQEIRGLGHDDQGVLWVSVAGKLARVDGDLLRSGRVTLEGATLGRVRAFHRDDAGVLWVATANGLARRAGGAWRLFGTADGLPPRELFQLVSDRQGVLWAGTSHGILRVPPGVLLHAGPGPRPGLVLHDTSGQRRDVAATRTRQPGAVRAGDGSLWFATARGVVRVDPERLRPHQLPPSVRIESAVLDGRSVALTDGPAVFPPGAGNLEVHFGAITLLEPGQAQHRYRLEGFDPDWIEAGPRRTAYYTNLPPGRYRFRVQGSNADGIWNQAGDTLVLRLRPHFHRTGWFFGVLALLAAALAVSAHRLRVSRVRSGFAAALAERTRIARELHDSLLQGMAGSVMRLRGLRKRLAGAPDAGDPGGARAALAAELREVEHQVAASIVETRQTVLGLREARQPPVDPVPALDALVRQLAQGHPVRTTVAVQGRPRPLHAAICEDLLRIAGEAVKNALHHAAPRHIQVELRFDDGALTLSVTDDGRGFDPDVAPDPRAGHFGLLGIRERAARLGGLRLQSGPGQGTRLEVTARAPYAAGEAR
jgi:ligand-binding sensor domain-containing protein/signal transduction histidine kinase